MPRSGAVANASARTHPRNWKRLMKRVLPSIAAGARAPGWPQRAVMALLAAGVPCAGSAAAPRASDAALETALTIYSSTRPGGIPVDLYRPVAGREGYAGGDVPGYAMVREERRLTLAA